MSKLRLLGSLLVAALLVLAVVLGAMSLATEVQARCICPQIYAPVICDHGKTYPNQCVADCRNAKNCVPTGGF